MKQLQAAKLTLKIAEHIYKPKAPLTMPRMLTLYRRLDIIEHHVTGLRNIAALQ